MSIYSTSLPDITEGQRVEALERHITGQPDAPLLAEMLGIADPIPARVEPEPARAALPRDWRPKGAKAS